MLKVRVLAAMVFAPVLLGIIIAGEMLLHVTCLILSVLLAWEYQRMTLRPQDVGLKALGLCLTALGALAVMGEVPSVLSPLVIPLGTLGVLLAVLTQPLPIAESMQRASAVALGALWSGGLLPYVAVLRDRPVDGMGLALIGLFCCWASDTGAYFAGRAFGRRPLYPLVSPKKTLEGGAGGVVCAIAMALALGRVMQMPVAPQHLAAMGALGAVAGVLGDLCESLLKRSAEVKDSSQLIPGHGGVFDRFDGVVFAVPAVYIYVTLFVGAPRPL